MRFQESSNPQWSKKKKLSALAKQLKKEKTIRLLQLEGLDRLNEKNLATPLASAVMQAN